MNYQNIKFSDFYSKERIKSANKIIGTKIVKWILAFALYLFGATRQIAAESQGISYDTFKSFTQRIEKEGFAAFYDKRYKDSNKTQSQPIKNIQGYYQDDYLIIDLGNENKYLRIPNNNTVQIKTILLSFYKNNLLDKYTVSKLLRYKASYTQMITKRLFKEDAIVLHDQRQGQKKDYAVTSEIKAEIIKQYTANLAGGKKTSSNTLSQDLKERCNISLPDRTIRFHIEKLGLAKIKDSFLETIETVKKNSKK
jgi:hypothetical protein